jgi:hypothetical protein
MRSALIATVLVVPALAVAGPKKEAAGTAAKQSPPACGVKLLPLVEGNTWTYENVAAPTPAEDAIKRIAPEPAKSIVITVKQVDAKKGADTVVTLEEKVTRDLTKDPKKPLLDERTITTTITCSDKKFMISPDSFWFAGEPGGYVGLKIDSLDHPKAPNASSWVLAKGGAGFGDQPWREELALHWTRVPHEGSEAKLGSGKLELERSFQPQMPENVGVRAGTFMKTEKLGLITTGRVTLDNPGVAQDKPAELPANWLTTLWIAPGTGVVQTINSYAHEYQLVSATLK